MKKIIWVIVAIIILAGGYWWWMSMQNPAPAAAPDQQMGVNGSPDQGNMGGAASSTQGVAQPQGDGTSVSDNLALGTDSNTKLGTYLIAYNGMTLYTYAKDSAGVSTCTGTCAQNWPPYTVPAGSTLNLQAGINGGIGTLKRADGTIQVTYRGMPLYFYAGDKASGDTNGQGVDGVWEVVKP